MFVWSKFVLWRINNWLHVQLKLPSTAARGLHEWGYFLSGCLDCLCWDWLCKLLYAWNIWRLGWMSEEERDNLFCYKIIFLSVFSWVGGLHSCRPGNNLQVVLFRFRMSRVCLTLLSAMVAQGPDSARDVYSHFDFNNKSLPGLVKKRDKKVN